MKKEDKHSYFAKYFLGTYLTTLYTDKQTSANTTKLYLGSIRNSEKKTSATLTNDDPKLF